MTQTIKIHAPGEHSRELVYQHLKAALNRHPYQRGHDQQNLFLDFLPWEEPRLVLVELNLLPGVRASLEGENPQPESAG